MATKLDKAVVRESTEMADERNIMVCFQTDQTIRLKLKGMKSGVLTVGIKELYDYLLNKDKVVVPEKAEPKAMVKSAIRHDAAPVVSEIKTYDTDEPLININDWRSSYMILDIPYDIKVKLEARTISLLAPYKMKKEEKKRKIREKQDETNEIINVEEGEE